MRTRMWMVGSVGLLFASLTAVTSYGDPDDVTPFLGAFETKGRYSTLRMTKASIEIEQAPNGALSISRTGKYRSWRFRKLPAFTWTSKDVRLDGDTLRVTYRITPDGVSVNPESIGIAGVLDEERLVDADGQPVDAAKVNVFTAKYFFEEDGTFREEVKNRTRHEPEHFWKRIGTKGEQTAAPEPIQGRVKLGGELAVKDGKFTVVVPTDGELVLEVSSGVVADLMDPSGDPIDAVAAVYTASRVTLTIPHENPTLGVYAGFIQGAGEGAVLEARFVQRGKIDPRIRPWSSHTYYPIYEESWGGENSDTLYCTDGPLAKLDQALGLTGRESAVWWEKGGDYRTGFGFEHGHYTKVSSPSEQDAEAEWKADLDADGVIETETKEEALARLDTDSDGKVSEAEAKAALEAGVIKAVFKRYDSNGDDAVTKDEIFESFVTKHDADGDDQVDLEEWGAALRADYPQVIESRMGTSLATFMGRDADGDGQIAAEELEKPGASDFHDSGDVDGDYKSFFDRDNIKIVTKAGETHYGNKVVEEGGKLKLFKGRKQDQLVVELDPADVAKRDDGIADGDLDDSYSVGWWGHCNAWSMASIVFRKPTEAFESNGVTFDVRDQKGILVEFGMGDTEDSTFWWQQWGGDDIPPAKYAAAFHRQLHRWLRVEQKGMMADMDFKDPHNQLNFQVWNYPLLGYEAELTEAEGDDPYVLDVACELEKGSYSDEDSSSTASVSYRLQFAPDGSILDGDEAKTDWTQKNYDDQREYIRYLIHPFRFTDSSGSRNANLTLERIEQAFGDHLKYNSLEALAAEEAAAAAAASDGGLSGTEPGSE